MARRNYVEHARVTAICVNLALDGVEADLHEEIDRISDEAAAALKRVLDRLKKRRVDDDTWKTAGNG